MSTDENWDKLQGAMDSATKDNHELTFTAGKLYGQIGWYPHEPFTILELAIGKKSLLCLDLIYIQVAYLQIVLCVDL